MSIVLNSCYSLLTAYNTIKDVAEEGSALLSQLSKQSGLGSSSVAEMVKEIVTMAFEFGSEEFATSPASQSEHLDLQSRVELLKNPANSQKALIFMTTQHYNRCFNLTEYLVGQWENMAKTQSVEFNCTESFDTINRVIDEKFEAQTPAKNLVLFMHGNSFTVVPSASEYILSSDTVSLIQIKHEDFKCIDVADLHFDNLDKNAAISLSACHSGKRDDFTPNIADWVKVYAGPNREVTACSEEYCGMDFTWTKQQEMRFLRKGETNEDGTYSIMKEIDKTEIINYEAALKKVNAYLDKKIESFVSMKNALERGSKEFLSQQAAENTIFIEPDLQLLTAAEIGQNLSSPLVSLPANCDGSSIKYFDIANIPYNQLSDNAVILFKDSSPVEMHDVLPNLAELMQIYAGPSRTVLTALENVEEVEFAQTGPREFILEKDGKDITAPISYASSHKKISAFVDAELQNLKDLKERIQRIEMAYLSVEAA